MIRLAKLRTLPIILCAPFLCGAQAPQDASMKVQQQQMGQAICGRVLDDELSSFSGATYRDAIAAARWERSEFCQCVGAEFADDPDDRFGILHATGDDEVQAMLTKIDDSLRSCLPTSGNMADLVGGSETLSGEDAEDARMCRMALSGDFPVAGFHVDQFAKRLEQSGQSADDICGCTGKSMPSGREAFEAEVNAAQNPNVVYGSRLAGRMNKCLR